MRRLKPKRAHECVAARMTGSTLAEVVIALLLVGIAALAALALQTSAAQTQRAAWREWRAAALAEAAAEALYAGEPSTEVEAGLQRQTRAALPSGEARIAVDGARFAAIVVHWREASAARAGDVGCASLAGADRRCFVLRIAQRAE